jgi:hypothetical protein
MLCEHNARMRRHDMTSAQIAARDLVLRDLKASGWSDERFPSNRWLDDGLWTFYAASVEYLNSNGVRLVVHYRAEVDRIYFSIIDTATDRSIDLLIELEGDAAPLVGLLTKTQDSISMENFRRLLREIVAAYEGTYAATGEERDKVVHLTDERGLVAQPRSRDRQH